MKPLSFLGYVHLTKLANPVCDREIYKLIKKHKFQSILEIGMEDGSRCEKMIRVAQKYGVSSNVKYTGIDLFDSREQASPLALIEMHRRLKSFGNAKTHLVPGPASAGVSRIANSHLRTDLIVVSAQHEQDSLEGMWFYFPRMLHAASIVLVQNKLEGRFSMLNRHQIEKRLEPGDSVLVKAA